MFYTAILTFGIACIANGSSVIYNAVTEVRGTFRWQNFSELSFDFRRIFQIVYKAHTIAQTNHVGVYHNASGEFIQITENQVGSLSTYAGKCNQFIHSGGNLTVMVFKKCLCTKNDVPCFCSKKTAGMYILLQFALICLCISSSVIGLKKKQ